MTDHERQLLARARELADLGELAETVTGILGGGRRSGLDPAALGGLVGAATALGAAGLAVYTAGGGPGTGYASEGEFLSALADAEYDIAERLKADRAMHTGDPCDGAMDARPPRSPTPRRAAAAQCRTRAGGSPNKKP